jgi:hypothetical protein
MNHPSIALLKSPFGTLADCALKTSAPAAGVLIAETIDELSDRVHIVAADRDVAVGFAVHPDAISKRDIALARTRLTPACATTEVSDRLTKRGIRWIP